MKAKPLNHAPMNKTEATGAAAMAKFLPIQKSKNGCTTTRPGAKSIADRYAIATELFTAKAEASSRSNRENLGKTVRPNAALNICKRIAAVIGTAKRATKDGPIMLAMTN